MYDNYPDSSYQVQQFYHIDAWQLLKGHSQMHAGRNERTYKKRANEGGTNEQTKRPAKRRMTDNQSCEGVPEGRTETKADKRKHLCSNTKLRISLIMYFKCSSINPPWLSLHHPELGSTPP